MSKRKQKPKYYLECFTHFMDRTPRFRLRSQNGNIVLGHSEAYSSTSARDKTVKKLAELFIPGAIEIRDADTEWDWRNSRWA